MLAEILNVVQVFTTAHAVTVVTIVTVVQRRSASRKWQKTRVKPENTWSFPGIFGYYPHWTLEIVVGHCPGLPYCCSAGLTLATVVGEPHCCSVVTVNTSNTVQLPTLNSSRCRTVWNALAGCRPKMSASKGLVLAPFLYAWVSEDECAPDLRGHQSRLHPTAIPPALECRSATRFTPRLRAASRSGDDARPPPTPP